jgi:hypothetical protein
MTGAEAKKVITLIFAPNVVDVNMNMYKVDPSYPT